MKIVVRRRDGAVFEREVTYSKGHYRNPMDDDDVHEKFTAACKGVMADGQRGQIRAAWWGLADADHVADICASMARYDRAPAVV